MSEKSSINYTLANEKIRDLVFEEWEKMTLLLNEGPDIIKEYFCKLWKETKQELEYEDDIDITDMERQVKPDDFQISYSALDNDVKVFNFIMPKPITDDGQAFYVSIAITQKIPRFFILELEKDLDEKDSYVVWEWQIDFENSEYVHKKHGTINKPDIKRFLEKINGIL